MSNEGTNLSNKGTDLSSGGTDLNTSKTVFFMWLTWNKKRLEKYLEKMASEGWHLTGSSLAHTKLKFEKAPSRQVSYCLDFQAEIEEEYKSNAESEGWRLTGDSNGWLLWEKEYEGERPTFITDPLSLKAKSRRTLIYVVVILATQIPMIKSLTREFSELDSVFGMIPMGLYILIILTMIYSAFRLYKEGTK